MLREQTRKMTHTFEYSPKLIFNLFDWNDIVSIFSTSGLSNIICIIMYSQTIVFHLIFSFWYTLYDEWEKDLKIQFFPSGHSIFPPMLLRMDCFYVIIVTYFHRFQSNHALLIFLLPITWLSCILWFFHFLNTTLFLICEVLEFISSLRQ